MLTTHRNSEFIRIYENGEIIFLKNHIQFPTGMRNVGSRGQMSFCQQKSPCMCFGSGRYSDTAMWGKGNKNLYRTELNSILQSTWLNTELCCIMIESGPVFDTLLINVTLSLISYSHFSFHIFPI